VPIAASTYKRPESVLVVIYTAVGEVLLLQRREPPDFWQSVTGSLHWDEVPAQTAARELVEETGITGVAIEDCGRSNRYPILPAWRARYAPDVYENVEHVFRVQLPQRTAIRLNPAEHVAMEWLPFGSAARRASSQTNRVAILELGLLPSQKRGG
jgi:dATP pyrophosphohydrolase